MKLLLIGYGKMGRTIEAQALSRGHQIAGIIDPSHPDVKLADFGSHNADVAIEFTHPDAAFANVTACLRQGLPVVCGSTGWLHRFPEAKALAQETGGSLFYASNYSVGVNLFFHFNEYVAAKMHQFGGYDVQVREIHHVHKVDQPSGTALTVAEGILRHYPEKKTWRNDAAESPQELAILSERSGEVVGTHIVTYSSSADVLELKHEALSREGFAHGAVLAAEWLPAHQGVFGMKDLLGL
ncbi:4-hydroxy-tetrahydrodipicolinate reductase [Hymenobacter busanensis]|uniref:4-hydroxy-tetrahydrodipicolinate reductase n=1 Tax=Hymenobacter busanensis TaxID=2607656 RepID=A0A7L5A240_9BACT|nr:4-hydroxy-tetrahydrodipicolinate reductase [Hymenobacter busanensis]KAA9338219.1 4-hydroxy-tetrahydrodipicolinate reductase [Hymenobacter busanensis]QHJ09357.1 4-hydroxy-tetrahydrodipicolinate reductase [Hymenobacter busanensis]